MDAKADAARVSLRLRTDLKQAVETRAKDEGRSVNAEIVRALEAHVARPAEPTPICREAT